jgi:excisionase family DNA binding protein
MAMNDIPSDPLAYPIPDAVRAAGIGRSFIYCAIKAGDLPVVKMGRRTLILRADLETWLRSHRATSADALAAA